MAEQRFLSITHLHIYAVINTIIKYPLGSSGKKTVRLLDVGCGNGVMLSTLTRELPSMHPGIAFEFYGLDVDDSNVQEKGFFDKTISLLTQNAPATPWQQHLKLIKSEETWPFPNDFFDIVYSNQVMEHVFNQAFTLAEIRRTMTPEGFSFHLYPLRHYIYEGHLFIPLVHKFRSWTTTYHWIRWASHLGIGTYKIHKKEGLCRSINEYAERHADYMAYQVNYQTAKQICNTAKACRLKPSFDFTHLYYKQKLRSVFKLNPLEIYKQGDISSARNSFYFFFLKYVSGITLVLKKKDSF